MTEKLPVRGFMWMDDFCKMDEDFVRGYDKNDNKGYILEVVDKKNYVVHINVLKQALDHGLKLRKVHRVIEFDQEAWLKEYIGVNTE